MSKIFEIYSDTLLSQIETLEEEFKGLIKDINLQEKWSHEKFEEIEIKKCFIRSALRYSENSQILLNILNNEISKNDYFKNFNWFTRFFTYSSIQVKFIASFIAAILLIVVRTFL